MRETMRPYTRELMRQAHETGAPVIRTLFFEFPDDPAAWDRKDEYLYGPDVLVAPVAEAGARQREVYLPAARPGRTLPTAHRTRAARPSWSRRPCTASPPSCATARTPNGSAPWSRRRNDHHDLWEVTP